MKVAEVARRTGLNRQSVQLLSASGVLSPGEGGFTEASVAGVREGAHYVVCQECTGRFIQLSQHVPKHGLNVSSYLVRYPNGQIMSDTAIANRAKTPEQKAAQSRKLKDRFRTPEGEKTRQEIAEAARRMQAGDYGSRAAAHLRELNSRPDQKARRSAESKARWDFGEQRAVIRAWQAAHPDQVLASAAHARRHIRKHFTKLHETVKVGLVASGLNEFITEHEVGFYSIDEAMPGIQLAVEVDGCWWHGCHVCGHPGVGAIRSCDARKTSYLTNRGWTIIRLAEHDIKADIDGCVGMVRGTVERLCEERRVA